MSYLDLLNVCESIQIQITGEISKAVEKETNYSKLWYTHRAGRVIASHMKAICHTKVANPSQSLIKSVCYPEASAFPVSKHHGGVSMKRKLGIYTLKSANLNTMTIR